MDESVDMVNLSVEEVPEVDEGMREIDGFYPPAE
jgi:hypothetical protein